MRTIVLALGAALLAASPVSARDYFVADWAGDCPAGLQCQIEIRPGRAAGTYRVTYLAADRYDIGKVRCSVRGSVRKTDRNTLRGTLGSGGRIVIAAGRRNGNILVSGADDSPCGEPMPVNGRYGAIGD